MRERGKTRRTRRLPVTAAAVFFLISAGCAGKSDFVHISGGAFEVELPVYQGKPHGGLKYRSVGEVKGSYVLGEGGYSIEAMRRAMAVMTEEAGKRGANAVVDARFEGPSPTGEITYIGQAVVF